MSAQSPAGKRQAKVARRGSAEKARSSRGGAPTSAVAGRAWGEFESQYTPAFLNLKPYDFERLPRAPLVTDDRTIQVPYKALNSELQCPVCMSIIREACVVRECLHRFCRECIHKCLRLGKKECPACRTHVPSRRSCRPDPAFDRLIRTVYCDPEEFAAKQAAAISATNQRENFNSAYTAGASEAVEAQKKMRKRRHTKVAASRSSRSTASAPLVPARSSSRKREAPVSAPAPVVPKRARLRVPSMPFFALRRHPSCGTTVPPLTKEHLRASKMLSVGHIKKFLYLKLSQPEEGFSISVFSPSGELTCPDVLTLQELYERYWDGDMDKLELLYSFDPSKRASALRPVQVEGAT